MSTARHARAIRQLGGFAGGTSRLARPPAVLEEPDIRPTQAPAVCFEATFHSQDGGGDLTTILRWTTVTAGCGISDPGGNYDDITLPAGTYQVTVSDLAGLGGQTITPELRLDSVTVGTGNPIVATVVASGGEVLDVVDFTGAGYESGTLTICCGAGLFSYNQNLDTDTVSHSGFFEALDRDAGDFMLAVLGYVITNGTPVLSLTDGDPEWDLQLATIAGPSDHRFFVYTREADITNDNLTWAWSGTTGVIAGSVIVAIRESGHSLGSDSDFFDVLATTFSDSFITADPITILWVWSDGGTTVDGAEMIMRTESFDATFGFVEAWAYQGSGTINVDVTALTGDIKFLTWQTVA